MFVKTAVRKNFLACVLMGFALGFLLVESVLASGGAGLALAPAASPAPTLGSLSCGRDHCCAVRLDGTVACWGSNTLGQGVPPAGTFTQVSTGDSLTCGLRTDGTLACWGYDRYGLGTPPAGTFTQVSLGDSHACGLKTDGTVACWGADGEYQAEPPAGTFTQVIASYVHTCGLKTDGTSACWGRNSSGESSPPAGTFTQISSIGQNTCGLKTDGPVACWGDNYSGQSTPPADTFTQVAAGSSHTCGLRTDGTLACWGDNGDGRSTPPAGTFTQVAAGVSNTCGLRTNGTLACWGSNGSGQSTPPAGANFSRRPVDAGSFHTCEVRMDGVLACWGGWAPIASPPAGAFTGTAGGQNHVCGLRTDGTVACWGENLFGESSPPSGTFTELSAGGQLSCGLKTDGTVACWGSNWEGKATPPSGTFTRIATGDAHSCGLKTDGTVACWGYDAYGETLPPASTFTQVAVGALFSCGLRTDGTVACWGDNRRGQSTPPGGTFTQITAGYDHACGLKTDGTPACWGANDSGESTPPGGTFTGVTAGDLHTCGLRTDGVLICWGSNTDGAVTPVQFSLAASAGAESATPALIGVRLLAASTQTIRVGYATADGSAFAGSDYTTRSGILTFLPGETRKTIGVPILNNTVVESDESFSVTLSNPVNAPLGANAVHVFTIQDDDASGAIRLSSAAYSVSEAGLLVTITAQRIGGSLGDVTVVCDATDGTATVNNDFGATHRLLHWGDGDRTSKTFTVPILNDALDEANETFRVLLSGPTGGAVLGSPAGATVTIVDDDPLPAVRFSAPASTTYEGLIGSTEASLSAPSGKPVTVRYATAGGTAVAGQDFISSSGSAIFLPGQTVRTIPVPIVYDGRYERDETFSMALSRPVNARLGSPSRQTITILNENEPPTMQVLGFPSGAESTTPVAFEVRLTRPSGLPATVRYATVNGSAMAGSDYAARSGTLTFLPGQTRKTIFVSIVNDTSVEPDETFSVHLTDPVNAVFGIDTHVYSIQDEDTNGAIRLSAAAYSVGEAGPSVTITAQRIGGSSGSVSAVIKTSGDTATEAGVLADFALTEATLFWATGDRANKSFTVPIVDDARDEPNETFEAWLSDPTGGAVIGSPQWAMVTIVDNDPPPAVRFSLAGTAASEAVTASAVDVVLSAPSEKTVTVKYATANGTAVAGSDYVRTAGTLTFAPGETSKTIPVQIVNDTVGEQTQAFSIALSGPVNAVLGSPAKFAYTILDDDPAPPIVAADGEQPARKTEPVSPAVPNDFDGDGRSDVGVFDPASGQWRLRLSGGGEITEQLGAAGAIPVTGDFDGDGRGDIGVFDPATGLWSLRQSTEGDLIVQLGASGSQPVTGDFDGDGRCDIGVFDPSSGKWSLRLSAEGDLTAQLGASGSQPVTGDFDGDGRDDIGVYDPEGGQWSLRLSMGGDAGVQLGSAGTQPVTGDFDGDGIADFGSYAPTTGNWEIALSSGSLRTQTLGQVGSIPIVGDFDGDGSADSGWYQPAAPGGSEDQPATPGSWRIMQSTAGLRVLTFGGAGAFPVGGRLR